MNDLLDSSVKKKTVQDGFATIQDRVRHFYIDGLIVLITSVNVLLSLPDGRHSESLKLDNFTFTTILLIVYFLYYTLLEYFFGFTLGKLINKTRVVNLDSSKPSFIQILIRTSARLIPFGFITNLSPYGAALHDLFSKTRTIRFKKKYVVELDDY